MYEIDIDEKFLDRLPTVDSEEEDCEVVLEGLGRRRVAERNA